MHVLLKKKLKIPQQGLLIHSANQCHAGSDHYIHTCPFVCLHFYKNLEKQHKSLCESNIRYFGNLWDLPSGLLIMANIF